jgi:hypothetical protein
MHYSIAMPQHEAARKIFSRTLATLSDDPEMQRDRAALARACCSPRVPELLKRAPKPELHFR